MNSTDRIEIPPHVRGLVFDCDGTIADTMPLHYEAWVAALKEHSVEFSEALFYELAGMPTAQIIQMLNERHGHDMPVQETADYKESLYQKLIPRVAPIEPVVVLVKQFAGKLPTGRRDRRHPGDLPQDAWLAGAARILWAHRDRRRREARQARAGHFPRSRAAHRRAAGDLLCL
jgi:beta-phosphoglucomutase-like phosphatase (HAD superfamily)